MPGVEERNTSDAVLLEPPVDVRSRTRIGAYLAWLEAEHGLTFTDYDALWRWSITDLDAFWGSVWNHFEVIAHDEPSAVLADPSMPRAQWFPGATLNYAEHALRGADDQVVVVARSQTRPDVELTRGQLRDEVARVAASLRRLGVGPGDVVAAYMPNVPETLVALLASASVGATWACCAPEFGTKSVLDRLSQVDPKVLFAVDGYRFGRKDVDRRDEVRTIVDGLPSLAHVVTVPYLFEAPDGPGTTWLDLLADPAVPSYHPVPFDHPLWVLFSSGTTGLPKAIVHGHGGIVLETLKTTALQSDLGPDDRYFFFCPTGWVVWNLLVSGLLAGASIVMVDGDPTFPDALALWRTIDETGTTSFGVGATFLMLSRGAGLSPRESCDLSRLRGISSTGSPLPAEGFRWVYDHVNPEVFLQSTSGGTDICGAFVGGSPLLPVRAGKISAACLGVDVAAFDEHGAPVIGELGELVVSKPMPSMPVAFWNDPGDRRYREAYFEKYPGRWCHGDWIRFDADGTCEVTGRSDATLNRGGVRLGTSEFYAALEALPEVADTLVVHLEDPAGGLGELVLFAQLVDGAHLDDELRSTIARQLRSRLSPRHVPDRIYPVPGIPYNLTNKKLEIPVKRILQGVPRSAVLSDGAVRDPQLLEVYEAIAADMRAAA